MTSFGTACNGIGAPEQALIPLGWQCLWQAETEATPLRIPTQEPRGEQDWSGRGIDYDHLGCLAGVEEEFAYNDPATRNLTIL